MVSIVRPIIVLMCCIGETCSEGESFFLEKQKNIKINFQDNVFLE